MRSFFARISLIIAAIVLVAGPAFAAVTHDVSIAASTFTPAVVTATVGDTVRWTNNDFAAHNVTASDAAQFQSGNFSSGTFTHTFNAPGSYPYYCSIHPSMQGVVNVADLPEPVIPEAPFAALLVISGAAVVAGGLILARRTATRLG